jgi:gas vesicle protein
MEISHACVSVQRKKSAILVDGGSENRSKEGEKTMKTNQELEYTEHGSSTKSMLKGLLIGSLVGAGTVLLFAPQAGEQTRTELQQGVTDLRDRTLDRTMELRDRTAETVKDTVEQVKSRANQIKSDAQIKAEELQYQGKDLLAKQLDRIAQAAEAGKKALQES